jgi:hypothetical protein
MDQVRNAGWSRGRSAAAHGLALLALALAACAPLAPRSNRIAIETASGGAAVTDAECVVGNGSVGMTVKSPAVVEIARGNGDLHIVCNKPGYRRSEVLFQSGAAGFSGSSVSFGIGASSGGWNRGGVDLGLGMTQVLPGKDGAVGEYPARIVVEMTPLAR